MSKLYYQVGTFAFLLTTCFYVIRTAQLDNQLKEKKFVIDNTDYEFMDSVMNENSNLKHLLDIHDRILADAVEYETEFFDTVGEMDAFDELYCHYESIGIEYFEVLDSINNSNKIK